MNSDLLIEVNPHGILRLFEELSCNDSLPQRHKAVNSEE
jgi:hypothetical protein